LRVDDTLTEDNNAITRMINASLSYIENWTGVYMFARLKDYILVDGCVRVYDHPINTLIDPVEANVEIKTLYRNYTYGTDTSTLSLNIGYDDANNVPDDLKEVAFEIIDLMYNDDGETGPMEKRLSSLSTDILNRHKRFFL